MPLFSSFGNLVVFLEAALLLCAPTALAYQWPSPQIDALERLFYEGTEFSGFPTASLATDCVERNTDSPSPIAAEWLRLAYHDMATHNITDGTGGIDSSIYFELDRPENIGAGMFSSMTDFFSTPNKYISRSDVIAMGAAWAVAGCGGPILPLRGGRVDATAAGRPGVPEPQQDLATHTESFRLQGFNPTEMISLVACGHTIGGVRKSDFPTVVTEGEPGQNTDSNGVLIIDMFDTTQHFDTNVVTEYLNNSTQNPLIVTPDVTRRSDMRIFSSDANVTMQSISGSTAFANICQSLLTRMIETVPTGTQFTDEVQLNPFKIRFAQITPIAGQLVLRVMVRLPQPQSGPNPFGITKNVTLFWCDRRGANADCAGNNTNSATGPSISFLGIQSPIANSLDTHFSTFEFRAPITDASVSKFWFEVADLNGGGTVVQDNGGNGFVVDQDTLIFAPALSTIQTGSTLTYKIVAGIRSDSPPTKADLNIFDKEPLNSNLPLSVPLLSTVNFQRDTTITNVGSYEFYSATISINDQGATLDFDFVADGEEVKLDFLVPIELQSTQF